MIIWKKQEYFAKTISSSIPMIIPQRKKKENKSKKIRKSMVLVSNKLEVLNYLGGELKDF
jgi:hypothetical protein